MTRRLLLTSLPAAAQCTSHWKPEVAEERVGRLADGRYQAVWPLLRNGRLMTLDVDYRVRGEGVDAYWTTEPDEVVTTFRPVMVTICSQPGLPAVQRRKP